MLTPVNASNCLLIVRNPLFTSHTLSEARFFFKLFRHWFLSLSASLIECRNDFQFIAKCMAKIAVRQQ